MTEIPEFLQKISWDRLREQKALLLSLSNTGILTADVCSNLDGIIGLIDTIQDFAVDIMGLSEKEVFNLSEKDIL